MKRRIGMFFKIGVTLIIFIGIILFFIIDVEDDNGDYYQRISVKDSDTGTYFMKMAVVDLNEDPLIDKAVRIANDKKLASVENAHSSENVDAQIDEEMNELLAHRRKQHIRNSGDTLNKVYSDSEKQEFYYDNSIPDRDSRRKKKRVELFNPGDQKPIVSRDFKRPGSQKTLVHLCVVVCENRAAEALTMLKSAAIVTTDVGLVFHIVADKERQLIIQEEMDSWPPHLQLHISYHIYNIAFPQGPITLTAWNKLYKPCASQRLFLPDRLTSLDSLIYVDTDTIFLQSVSALWSFFTHFNSSQLVGMAQESEDGTAGWYNRFASHPYYGDYGVNSGVMLMNMTRIRDSTVWLSVLQEDYGKYRLSMTWGDQDLINIYLAKRPEQVYLLPCNWNYRTDHCMYTSNCRQAEKKGVSLVHASRGAFYSDKEPVFGAVYQAFQHVVFRPDQTNSLVLDLEKRLKNTSSELSSCNYVTSLFLTQLVRLAVLQKQSKHSILPQNSPSDHLSSHKLLQNTLHQKNNDQLLQDSQDFKMKKVVDFAVVDGPLQSNKGNLKLDNSLKDGSVTFVRDQGEREVGKKSIKSDLNFKNVNFDRSSNVNIVDDPSNVKFDKVINIVDHLSDVKSDEEEDFVDNLSNVKADRGAAAVREFGLSSVNGKVNKRNAIDLYDLTHNEVFINNKLKAGRFINVMAVEKDTLKSVEEKMYLTDSEESELEGGGVGK